MRFTIERLRTLVLAVAVLLLVALAVFLGLAKWKNPFNRRDLPKRLGFDIQQESNGVTFSHALGAHSQFKVHASKVVQLKQGNAVLHDVRIELYGEDGSRVDRIEGGEFEYDQKNGRATAAGPVEITLMRPGVAPAIAPNATPGKALSGKAKSNGLTTVAKQAEAGEVHVKTSGLSFDWNTGVTTTSQHVDFSMTQGSGSSMGATYDSKQGSLVLDHAVELLMRRGGEPVHVHAQHAEFERGDLECRLHAATADYSDGQATAGDAKIHFRENGTAARLDATGGLALTTATGSHLAAPIGSMDFDEHNQPRSGHLEGGVSMDSASEGRQVHGTSPSAELSFTPQGNLRHTQLHQGVALNIEEQSTTKSGQLRVSRTWKSPEADVEFRNAANGKVEPATMHGSGGVVITGESQRGKAAPMPSRLAADEVNGVFGHGSVLTSITGTGRAGIDQTTATGARQSASGDRLEAHFVAGGTSGSVGLAGGATQIQSAVLDGHVTLTQQPAAKPGGAAEAALRATAGKAVYEGAGEWMHLTASPRVEDGGMELTADKIDVSQVSGDAFAHGNVKATWVDSGKGRSGQRGSAAGGQMGLPMGGQGPAHAIAQEAQLHQAGGASTATFKGHARLWQQANSIAGPQIVLDREKQTLVAVSTDAGEPVRVVMLSAGNQAAGKPTGPSVVRVRGGDLRYSDAERRAVMLGGGLGSVVAETATATSSSNEVELTLLPAGSHASQSQVDRLTARGRVMITTQGRRGSGELLTYATTTGEYILTGTPASPPRITDPARGNVSGQALIFHSRDDSVSIEGGGRETRTETTAPR